MNKKSAYDFFIGLLSLMLALMLIIDIFVNIPKSVKLTFYYTDNVVRLIFIGDYLGGLVSNIRKKVVHSNIIDLISIIPLRMYLRVAKILNFTYVLQADIIVKMFKFFMLTIFIIKFRNRIKEEIKVNRFYYLLIISTIIIVIGAVIISLIEGISLGDALWWSFVTFTTVGYGDILLKTQLGRMIAVLLMIFGIGVIGVVTTTLALNITNGGKSKKKMTVKEQIIADIKYTLDNYDNLSDEDIDNIIKVIKSLRTNK